MASVTLSSTMSGSADRVRSGCGPRPTALPRSMTLPTVLPLASETVFCPPDSVVRISRQETNMMAKNEDGFAKTWKEIASSLLKLGVMSYGGPAIMGIMQTELHEKRQ